MNRAGLFGYLQKVSFCRECDGIGGLLGNVVSCITTNSIRLPSGPYIASAHHGRSRGSIHLATTRELRSYREEVKNALLTLGIFPIEQTNFRLAHGPLTAIEIFTDDHPRAPDPPSRC